MQTIRIRVSDQIYDRFLWLLRKFKKDEIEVIEENESFQNVQSDLKLKLEKIDSGKEQFLTLAEFESKLDQVISGHENNSE